MGHRPVEVLTTIQEATSLQARIRVYVELSLDNRLSELQPEMDYWTIGGAWSGFMVGRDLPSDNDLGEDWDAQVVNTVHFGFLLKPYHGKSIYYNEDGVLEFLDLEGEELTEAAIGRKWIIGLDIHV